jgi:hypothetical protein
VTGAGYDATGVVGAEVIIAAVPKPMQLLRTPRNISGVPRLLGLLIGRPMLADQRASGPLVSVGVDCAGVQTPSTAHNVFPNVARVDKWGGNMADRFTHPHSCLLAHNFLTFSSFILEPSVASLLRPPITAKAPNLPRSHLRSEDDLRRLRRLLG